MPTVGIVGAVSAMDAGIVLVDPAVVERVSRSSSSEGLSGRSDSVSVSAGKVLGSVGS